MTPRRDSLLRLARAFVDDETFARELALAVDEPEAHRKQHAARWKRRGLARASVALPADFPWLALIDGLVARGRAAEVDHRSDAEEVVAACRALVGAKTRPSLDAVAASSRDANVEEVLGALAASLVPKNLALVKLDRAWDSIAFAAVPAEAVASMVALARRAGFGRLVHVEPAALSAEAAPRRRARARPASAAKARSAAATYARFCAAHGFRSVDALLYGLPWRPEATTRLAELGGLLESAPARDRARLRYFVAMAEGTPSVVAREADDPRACFTAVDALVRWQGREAEGLCAAAVLVRRLGLEAEPAAMALPKGAAPWPWSPTPFSVVRFCVFPKEREAAVAKAFATLEKDDRELFREFVRAGLEAKDRGVVERSQMAARVVGVRGAGRSRVG